jgi:hypothetical protein
VSEVRWFPEAVQSLSAVFRLAAFDRRAAAFFTDDIHQCARSFRACVLVFPFFVYMRLGDLLAAPSLPDQLSMTMLVQVIEFVVTCLIFPVAVLPLLRWYQREARWPRLVTIYNWWGLGQTILVAGAIVVHRLTGANPFSSGLLLLINLFGILVEVFLFELVLEAGFLTAATLAVIDLLLSEMISVVADAIV